MSKAKYTALITEEANRLGFAFVGFAKAEKLETEAKHLENWLNQGMYGNFDLVLEITH